MNYIDLAVLGVIAISALLGLSRGFVREMLGLGAWILAGWGALTFGDRFEPMATRALGTPDLGAAAAYAGLFVALLIVFSLLANLVGRAVRLSALGGLDRTLGLVFGLLRGDAVMVAAYLLVGFVFKPPWPPALTQARTVPFLYHQAVWATAQVPERFHEFKPVVTPPPDDKAATADDLLHVTPEGRALGPRTQGH